MKTNNLILYCILIMLSACCHKGCYKSGGECKERCLKKGPAIPDSVLNDFSFKNGSYWIYRDSISGSFDTVFVKNYSLSYESNNIYSCEVFQYLKITLVNLDDLNESEIRISKSDSIYFEFLPINYSYFNNSGSIHQGSYPITYKINSLRDKKIMVLGIQQQPIIYNVYDPYSISNGILFTIYFVPNLGIVQYDVFDKNKNLIKKYKLHDYKIS